MIFLLFMQLYLVARIIMIDSTFLCIQNLIRVAGLIIVMLACYFSFNIIIEWQN